MDAIKVIEGCGASGKSLHAGTVYAVPGDVSESDAVILVRVGKAIGANLPADQLAALTKPSRSRKVKD